MIKLKICNSKTDWLDALSKLTDNINLFINWDCSENLKVAGNKIIRLLVYFDDDLVGIYQSVVSVSTKFLMNFINIRCGGREEGSGMIFSDSLDLSFRILILEDIVRFVKKILKVQFGTLSIFYFGYYHLDDRLLSGFKKWKTKTPLLDLTRDDLWQNLDKKHRNEIRQAKKRNVVISIVNNEFGLEQFYRLAAPYWTMLKRTKWLNNKDIFFNFHRACFSNGLLNLFMAYVNNKPAAFALIWGQQGSKKIIYGEGGVADEFKWNRPSHLLLWKVIEWGKMNGFEVFDMAGGSDNPKDKRYSISQFKVKFGAELKEVCKYHKLSL